MLVKKVKGGKVQTVESVGQDVGEPELLGVFLGFATGVRFFPEKKTDHSRLQFPRESQRPGSSRSCNQETRYTTPVRTQKAVTTSSTVKNCITARCFDRTSIGIVTF